jgi:hypothetical protein
MDRRSFLARFAPVCGAAALVPIAVPVLGSQTPDIYWSESADLYHIHGRIDANSIYARHLRGITIDGEMVPATHVVEADDSAGWAMIFTDDKVHMPGTARRTGDVRYLWSVEPLY